MGSVRTTVAPLSLLLVVSGCATTGPIAWSGAPPHAITLNLTGPEVNNDKRVRCEQIARDAGATLVDRAPVTVTLDMAPRNRLTISTSAKRVLFDESRPPWPTAKLCADAVHKVAAVYPRGSVQDFIAERVMRDPALSALLTGAGHAQVAFTLAAETPIEELEEGSEKYVELQKAIGAAQDAYRRYASYGRALPASALDTAGQALLPEPDGKVNVQGAGVVLRVDQKPDRIALLAVESDRGRTILSFDGGMNAAVAPEFRAYLVGDRVDVSGVVKRRIKRDDTVAPAPARAVPVSAGCAKDTDCKGSRVCEAGRCVNPGK